MENKNLIVKNNKKGRGVYTGRSFRQGEMICVMKGEERTPRTLYYHGAGFRNAQMNPLQIAQDVYLDLAPPYIYINHSCEPNAGIRGKATLFALHALKKGEEITFDYSTTIDESFICMCGSKKCRGAVIDFFGLPRKLQKFYVEIDAVPVFIAKKYKKCRGK